jgi:hypothetical protein
VANSQERCSDDTTLDIKFIFSGAITVFESGQFSSLAYSLSKVLAKLYVIRLLYGHVKGVDRGI